MDADKIVMSALDWMIHGGSIGAAGIMFRVAIKMWKRLERDDALHRDYPPHRHINGKILFPHDYEPAQVEQLDGSGKIN